MRSCHFFDSSFFLVFSLFCLPSFSFSLSSLPLFSLQSLQSPSRYLHTVGPVSETFITTQTPGLCTASHNCLSLGLLPIEHPSHSFSIISSVQHGGKPPLDLTLTMCRSQRYYVTGQLSRATKNTRLSKERTFNPLVSSAALKVFLKMCAACIKHTARWSSSFPNMKHQDTVTKLHQTP